MARKEKTMPYGGRAIPHAEGKYSILRWGWGSLNRQNAIDTGQITDCSGVVIDPPYVTPALVPHNLTSYTEPISVHGFDDRLFVVYRDEGNIKLDCLNADGTRYTGVLGHAKGTNDDFRSRSMIQFNVASNTENIVEAEYVRKILIFPDSYSIDYDIDKNFVPAYLGDTYPPLLMASVYGSRVFGVDENLVYASSYNDYANWDLDTADDYNESNAWVSMSQSNVKADGAFTAITVYDNHVVLFKKDFLQLVYNNKNPFRIVDVGSYGCDNPNAVAECSGILYFASESSVYAFGGGTPKEISQNLDIQNFRGAVMGAWKDTLYLSTGGCIYTFKDGVWSSLGASVASVVQFASCDWGIVALFADGSIKVLDWLRDGSQSAPGFAEQYGSANGEDWYFETDLMAAGKLDVRRVKKVSILCEMEEGSHVEVYLLRNDENFDKNKSFSVSRSTGSGMVMLRALTRMQSGYLHRLRIVGRGKVKIYAAEIQIAFGGDLYVEG